MNDEPRFKAFVAIGDSFTEGMNDIRADGSMRGWADRLAGRLGDQNPNFRYANLAVRGKLLRQIEDEQLPVALAAGADLFSIAGGGNDILRPRADIDALAEDFERIVLRLRATGARVLMFTGFDPTAPILRLARGRAAIYNSHLRQIATRTGADLVEMWALTSLRTSGAFSDDRLHLTAPAHERVARLAAATLGVATDDPYEPLAAAPPATRMDDWRWAREHLYPWLKRHARGRSSGDELTAKRPNLDAVGD
jgi:lysophospholipase L1-like esterase